MKNEARSRALRKALRKGSDCQESVALCRQMNTVMKSVRVLSSVLATCCSRMKGEDNPFTIARGLMVSLARAVLMD